MPIHVECGECFSGFDVSEKYAGRRVRCRSCGQPVRVPQAPRFEVEDDNTDAYALAAESASSAADESLPPPVPTHRQERQTTGDGWRFRASPTLLISGFLLAQLILMSLIIPFWIALCLLIFFVGFCVSFRGNIDIWRAAFNESLVNGLIALPFPGLYLVYACFTNWPLAKRVLRFYLAGTGIMLVGIVGSVSLIMDQIQKGNWKPVPDHVARHDQPAAEHAPTDHRWADQPPANSRDLYLLGTLPPRPRFDENEFRSRPFAGVQVFDRINPASKGQPGVPGSKMQYRVYLPPGDHPHRSLGCILVPPAGTTLLTGAEIGNDAQHPEHIPYVNAGYAVVTFSLDGWLPNHNVANHPELQSAWKQFQAASAGLINAKAAFDFAAHELPAVDPRRIYIAGHSSAGTLALLFAEHEPALAGCLAYAPQTDVEARIGKISEDPIGIPLATLQAFATRSSPKTHAARLTCPVFVYHAAGDTVISAASTRAFCDWLRTAGKDVTHIEGLGSDHYQTMIDQGIPNGLQWLAERSGSSGQPPMQVATNRPGKFIPETEIQLPADPTERPYALRPGRGSTRRLPPPLIPPSTGMPPPLAPPGSVPPPGFIPPPIRPSPALPSAATRPSSSPQSPPPGTRPVRSAADLTVGMRVFMHHGARWEGAEVVEVLPPDRAKVRLLRLPESIERVEPLADLHIPLAARELSSDLVETLSFEILRITGSGSPDPAAIELKLLELEGYLPGTLQLDVAGKTASMQVVRGSRAEKDAHFAMSRGKVIVRSGPSRNRAP